MKEVLLFVLEKCPYCIQAMQWQEELMQEHPEWREIPIRIVDERKEAGLAGSYDYYYVPCYFVDGVKIHEGAAQREQVEQVLRSAFMAKESTARH